MKHSFTAYVKMSIWGFLAMTCISCAHQSREASLMIDTETPSDEHVWSETREVQETVATENEASEEQQLAEVEKTEGTSEEQQLAEVEKTEAPTTPVVEEMAPQAAIDQTINEVKTDSISTEESLSAVSEDSESQGDLEASVNEESSLMVANNDLAKADEGSVSSEANPEKENTELSKPVSDSEPSREVSSEAPMEEVTPPSQAEPTIGVPSKLKSDDKVPTLRNKNRSKTWRGENRATVQNKPLVVPKTLTKQPEVAIVSPQEMNAKHEVASATQMNELGEESEPTAQLASVEIANFIQNHWLLVLLSAGIFVTGLFFFLRKKREDDPQAI